MSFLRTPAVENLINLALSEDLNGGDSTSEALFEDSDHAKAVIKAKSDLIICGLPLIHWIFEKIDASTEIEILKNEGDFCSKGTEIAVFNGKAISLLAAERTILNFLQRLSAISTATRELVDLTSVGILDTRKTIPGHRWLEKYAVRVGGGRNHRFNLSSGIMIKDNHIDAYGSIEECVKKARSKSSHTLKIEVEVRNMAEAEQAINANADILLLDNMTNDEMFDICSKFKGKAIFEASGGITRERLTGLDKTGVDFVSLGAITHSVKAADINMTIVLEKKTTNDKK